MSILHDLLEYEDPTMKGIPLQESQKRLMKNFPYHHRYHRTKAGLYVVLRHGWDGEVQKRKPLGGSNTNSRTAGEQEMLPDCFSFDSVFSNMVFDVSTNRHYSGISVEHKVTYDTAAILSLNLRCRALFGSQYDFQHSFPYPAWEFTIERNGDTPSAEGSFIHVEKINLDRLKRKKLPVVIKGKTLDYEATLKGILSHMKEYNAVAERADENINKDTRKIEKKLSSLEVLVFR